jgi:hypothetical protein
MDELLDDKKLIDAFNRVVLYGVSKEGKIKDNKGDFSRRFIICLLRTRYLFDKYIIKREYANDSTDGEWSLKSLYVSGQQSKKKPYYKNSKFTQSGEWTSTNDKRNKTNIMIQSALRVSYTSPKVMHWITKLLIWLSEGDCKHIRNDDIIWFNEVAEDIAIEAVKENFFNVCQDGVYAMGVNTPHIVFNYLDYLLWHNDCEGKGKYNDFIFEFRNSVEHWYPQELLKQQLQTEELTQEMLKNYYKLPVMCLLRIKDSVDTWDKRSGANGYFNFIESYMGSQIKGTEMKFSILSTGLINM